MSHGEVPLLMIEKPEMISLLKVCDLDAYKLLTVSEMFRLT